jgi:hypothetical protein
MGTLDIFNNGGKLRIQKQFNIMVLSYFLFLHMILDVRFLCTRLALNCPLQIHTCDPVKKTLDRGTTLYLYSRQIRLEITISAKLNTAAYKCNCFMVRKWHQKFRVKQNFLRKIYHVGCVTSFLKIKKILKLYQDAFLIN